MCCKPQAHHGRDRVCSRPRAYRYWCAGLVSGWFWISGTLQAWSLDLQAGERRATADAAGNYQFPPLAPGRYLVRQVVPAGMAPTTPAGGLFDLSLAAGVIAAGNDFGNHDNVAPQIVSANFAFAVKPHRLDVQFSEDVSASLPTANLVLVNRTTGAAVPAGNLAVTVGGNNLASWTYTANGGILPDGDYRATLAAGAVTDASGNALAAGLTIDFFVLGGDANRDRSVDFTALGPLAQKYNPVGKTFGQGDFNYDGAVDFNDLVILAQHYNTTLPNMLPPPAPAHAERAVVAPHAVAPVFSTRPIAVRAVQKPLSKTTDKHRGARLPH